MKDFAIMGRWEATKDIEALGSLALTKFTHHVGFCDSGDQEALQGAHPIASHFEKLGRQTILFHFDDVASPNALEKWGYVPPTKAAVAQLCAFVQGLPDGAVVLFQCEQGRSRSTAAAVIAWVSRHGPNSVARAHAETRRRREYRDANPLMLLYAGQLLGTDMKEGRRE